MKIIKAMLFYTTIIILFLFLSSNLNITLAFVSAFLVGACAITLTVDDVKKFTFYDKINNEE